MTYYAKLILGNTYVYKAHKFAWKAEEVVSAEDAEYLKTVGEEELTSDGNKYKVIFHPRFEVRFEEPTQEQRVLEEVAELDVSLNPRKSPGRPKTEK